LQSTCEGERPTKNETSSLLKNPIAVPKFSGYLSLFPSVQPNHFFEDGEATPHTSSDASAMNVSLAENTSAAAQSTKQVVQRD